MSDSQLEDVLEPARLGQPWALRVVFEVLAPKVEAYLRSRGAAEPEDLTSEVFLAVLPKLPTLSGGAAGLRTFTFSVAHARLVDDLRRQSRRAPAAAYDPLDDPRTVPSSETAALETLGTERVRRLLGTLTGQQRDVITLRILGDLTLDQVAEALGTSPGAVKQLQRRALLALREALAAETEGVTL